MDMERKKKKKTTKRLMVSQREHCPDGQQRKDGGEESERIICTTEIFWSENICLDGSGPFGFCQIGMRR